MLNPFAGAFAVSVAMITPPRVYLPLSSSTRNASVVVVVDSRIHNRQSKRLIDLID